jgi:hypothetical protein
MTLGNFTDAFMRKDLSKMSIGYIQDLGQLSTELLTKHLVSKTTFCKSTAATAIKEHKRYLEREFWAMCFEPLRQYEQTGVKMYILGKGVRVVFPILAYNVGDDPAQHRYCGVKEGNALHACIYCNYSVKEDGVFDPARRVPRQPQAIQLLSEVAYSGALKKSKKHPILGIEKRAMDTLTATGTACIYLRYHHMCTLIGTTSGPMWY